MATPKVMKLVDPSIGRMKCTVCASEHYASVKPHSDGQFYRGAWQCLNGCRSPKTQLQ